MVTKEQFINGLVRFFDSDVIPQLPTAGKWMVGAMVIGASKKAENIIASLSVNPVVKAMGMIDENGMIDIDLLADSLRQSADKYGKLSVSFPVVGTMTFSSNDIERAKLYITGGI